MSRSASSVSPTERELPPVVESIDEPIAPLEEPPPPAREVDRAPPPGAGAGLDDLFGFASEGRMRLGRSKKGEPSED